MRVLAPLAPAHALSGAGTGEPSRRVESAQVQAQGTLEGRMRGWTAAQAQAACEMAVTEIVGWGERRLGGTGGIWLSTLHICVEGGGCAISAVQDREAASIDARGLQACAPRMNVTIGTNLLGNVAGSPSHWRLHARQRGPVTVRRKLMGICNWGGVVCVWF